MMDIQIWEDYSEESWKILQEFRKIISTSVHLVSPKFFKVLIEQYDDFIGKDVILTTRR